VEKIYVGDYIYTGNNYSYTFVDRKSWSDFIGTLSSGLERFEREIQKAIDLSGYLFVVVESTVDEIKQNHGRFRCLNSLEYIFHNMRHLTHKYSGKIQFIFSGNRENSKKIIPKLLYHGKKLWETDVQFFLNFKKLL
jgi:ERCC4-type nuclease